MNEKPGIFIKSANSSGSTTGELLADIQNNLAVGAGMGFELCVRRIIVPFVSS